MKKKVKFTLRLLAIWLCAIGLYSLTQPGSVLHLAILTIAVFMSCTAHADYEDEKMEDKINKENNDSAE